MTGWRIVADVGGTNVRFARVTSNDAIEDFRAWPNGSFPSFLDALSRYVSDVGGLSGCTGIAVAAAGPVHAGTVQLTNGSWVISETEISHFAQRLPVRVINDLEAVALAIPYLKPGDVAQIGAVKSAQPGVKIAVNVGTGFGASIAVPVGSGWSAIPCEPGHMRLALSEAEASILGSASLSVEDVLSGPGTRTLYTRLSRKRSLGALLGGDEPKSPEPGDLFEQASTDAGKEFVDLFESLLGQVSGDLVLATGAWGGVYICGGLASAWFPHARHTVFRRAFEDKGPMSARMRNVFVGHITSRNAALSGLASLRFDNPGL